MLEVTHDAATAGEEQLVSCAAKQNKYCLICTVTFGPCVDIALSVSLGRWQCLRGGADAGLESCYAACGCGTEYRRGALPGGRGVTSLRLWRALPLRRRGDGAHCLSQINGSSGEQLTLTRPKLGSLERIRNCSRRSKQIRKGD